MYERESSHLNIKCRVETHRQVHLFVLVEYTEEPFPEDLCSERIGKHHDTIRIIRQILHLQEPNLIKASCK